MKPATRRAYFEEATPSQDLHHRSLRGGAVAIVAQAGNLGLQVGSTMILARILLPEDFGLVAMVTAVIGFASIVVDLGTRDAVAQRGSVNEDEVSALFWITLGVGVVLTAITAISAPLIARFYGEPRLALIVMTLSVTFALPALYFQQQALMRRALLFQRLALVDLAANLAATVFAIVLAYRGYGYWALVWKLVLTGVFTGVAVWISCGWRPKRPAFTAGVKEMLGFGLNITGFAISDYVSRSVDRVALGYTAGPRVVGFYQNAFLAYDNALVVCSDSLHNVATVTLSKLRGDVPALKRAWSTALSSLVYFVAPAFATLAVTGQDLIVLLLGSKWEASGAILSVLALRGVPHAVERTLGWLHVSAGRPDRWRRWGNFNCVATIVALLCGLPFGALGVAAAYTASMYLLFIPAIVYAGKPLGIGAFDAWKTVGPQVIAALGAAGVGFLVRHTVLQETAPLLRLVVLGILCCTVYLATMTLGFRMTKPLAVAASLVRTRVVSLG
jgi:polysaccharide transporter, PST family